MNETKNTIDGVRLTNNRANGNSTRQVDAAIDYLFKGLKVEVMDHFEGSILKNLNYEKSRNILLVK